MNISSSLLVIFVIIALIIAAIRFLVNKHQATDKHIHEENKRIIMKNMKLKRTWISKY